MSEPFRLRMSVLHIDRHSDLPLMYSYSQERQEFETAGYVRLGTITIWQPVRHQGPDDNDERDVFLAMVLLGLTISPHEVQRIVRTADHFADGKFVGTGSPRQVIDDGLRQSAIDYRHDGMHWAVPGLVVGLLLGLITGWLVAAWNGAILGGFAATSVCFDLFPAVWRVLHPYSPRNGVEFHDTMAVLLIEAGSLAGGVMGYLLGAPGFGQARGMFVGMALGALTISLVATTFSMVPFRMRLMTWLGPLIVGAGAWAGYSLWSNPIALAMGIGLGVLAATRAAWRFAPPDW